MYYMNEVSQGLMDTPSFLLLCVFSTILIHKALERKTVCCFYQEGGGSILSLEFEMPVRHPE